MHPNPRRIVPLILFLGLASALIYYLVNSSGAQADGPLTASGSIEAVEWSLSPEINARVVEVLAQEGDIVLEGQAVVRLDDSLLRAQLAQAQSALAQAEANYDLVAAGQPPEQQAAAIAAAELDLLAAQQDREAIFENWPDQATLAQQALKDARDRQRDAKRDLDYLTTSADQINIDLAYTQLILAEDALDKAQDDFEPFENKPETNLTRVVLQQRLAEAQKAYDAAVRQYNGLLDVANEFDVSQGEAELAIANKQLELASQDYEELLIGPDPDSLALADARIQAAEARLGAARAESPTPEQLAVAQAQIDAARAAIDVIETQLDKTWITAPADSVVLARLVEPGEMALPNAPLLTFVRLDQLTLTVFVPEDRYGEISLGQVVRVSVDSFPQETFAGRVIHIADKAEFTPRNVQTQEGRRTTVFAVKLMLEETGGKLKPGMPADVQFGEG